MTATARHDAAHLDPQEALPHLPAYDATRMFPATSCNSATVRELSDQWHAARVEMTAAEDEYRTAPSRILEARQQDKNNRVRAYQKNEPTPTPTEPTEWAKAEDAEVKYRAHLATIREVEPKLRAALAADRGPSISVAADILAATRDAAAELRKRHAAEWRELMAPVHDATVTVHTVRTMDEGHPDPSKGAMLATPPAPTIGQPEGLADLAAEAASLNAAPKQPEYMHLKTSNGDVMKVHRLTGQGLLQSRNARFTEVDEHGAPIRREQDATPTE